MAPVGDISSPLLSVKDAAAYLGMSRDWAYENMKKLIPHVKIGGALRFRKEDVDRYINRLLHVRPKETWNLKTDNSARTIPLCEPAIDAQRMAKERAEKKKMTNSLVFPGRNGGPLIDIRDSLDGACRRAGVPHIHIHEARVAFVESLGELSITLLSSGDIFLQVTHRVSARVLISPGNPRASSVGFPRIRR